MLRPSFFDRAIKGTPPPPLQFNHCLKCVYIYAVSVVVAVKLIGTNCSTAVDCCFCHDYVAHSSCVNQLCQCDTGYQANQLRTACLPRTIYSTSPVMLKLCLLPRPREGCQVYSEYVCLFVCLSVCLSAHNSKTARSNFVKIHVHFACGRGSVLL